MADSIPLQIAETIQTAHLVHSPSAAHDANPSTAASKKQPVKLETPDPDTDLSDLDDDDDDEYPSSKIKPISRRHPNLHHLPPLPDLRFEQSYLASIKNADTWWKVALITARDQMMMPLIQGVVYNLAICGWQHWNRNARLSGQSLGARVRRWWWGVNNWPIPGEKGYRRR
ncbi:hypothetical protein QBC40DRAFT_286821 [Triangularia verruculosa]|uniref:DUF1770-domain-containing protein n=1 Tax=Triangularia verruculosa TaxID=2587418 RepID=A0AAN6XDR5_9PEZI|nr:hypothetical protein QBC40DRAFT_286821 [Triangularia verruculosa]